MLCYRKENKFEETINSDQYIIDYNARKRVAVTSWVFIEK